MKRYVLLLGIFILVLAGCQADKDGINEKAEIEGKATSAAGIQAENANRTVRSIEMENDLERRRRFIDSVVGTYEGMVSDVRGNEGPIRFIITSSFPRLPESHRSRSIEEISYELTNLYLNVQVIEWSTINESAEIAFGCVYEQVRPNIVDGALHLMSKECKMGYALFSAELVPNAQIPTSSRSDMKVSKVLASDVVDGKLMDIPAFVGRKQSNLSSKRVPLRVKKVASQ